MVNVLVIECVWSMFGNRVCLVNAFGNTLCMVNVLVIEYVSSMIW